MRNNRFALTACLLSVIGCGGRATEKTSTPVVSLAPVVNGVVVSPSGAPPSLFDATRARTADECHAAQVAWAAYLGQPSPFERNSIGMELVLIPPGRFNMGSPESDSHAEKDEQPQVVVTLTQPLYVGKTEVTQGQWETLMGTRPWHGSHFVKEGRNYPATPVRASDADAFCWELSQKEGATYRLLTEAEWEYACRAGTLTRFYFGDNAALMGTHAWFRENTYDSRAKSAQEVGRKQPNPFGLHDMYGNVGEWCAEAYVDLLPGGEDPVEINGVSNRVFRGGDWNEGRACRPLRELVVSDRVFRGGNWSVSSEVCRSALRDHAPPDFRDRKLGFRVARVTNQ